MRAVVLFIILLLATIVGPSAWATTFYIDLTASCPSGNYSIANRNCTGSDGVSYDHTTVSSMAVVAGDTVYVRSGTITTPFVLGSKAGAAGAYITFIVYPGETVTVRPTGPNTHMITQNCSAHHFVFQGFVFDGINGNNEFQRVILRSNCGGYGIPGYFSFYDNDIKNMMGHSMLINTDGFHVARNRIHDLRSPCTIGNKHYGLYIATGANHIIEHNEIYNTPGGYMQVYPGPLTGVVVRNNYFHNNTFCTVTGDFGGVIGNNAHGTLFHNNIVEANNFSGLQIFGGVDDVQIYNNLFYNNNGPGISFSGTGSTGSIIQNNLIVDNSGGTVTGSGAAVATQITNRTTGNLTDCATRRLFFPRMPDQPASTLGQPSADFRLMGPLQILGHSNRFHLRPPRLPPT